MTDRTPDHDLAKTMMLGVIGICLVWIGTNFVTALGVFIMLFANNCYEGYRDKYGR